MAKDTTLKDATTTWTLADVMRAYQKIRVAEIRVNDAKIILQAAKQQLAEAKRDLDEMMQQLAAEVAS